MNLPEPQSLICPACGATISLADVNPSSDVALCRACQTIHSLAGLLARQPLTTELTAPDGAWYEERVDGFDAGASTRSPILAIFLVPFVAVWISGVFSSSLTANTSTVPKFFFLPFYLGAAALITTGAMIVAGQVRLSRLGDDFEIFTGVGPIGWRRTYSWSGFRTVGEALPSFNNRGGRVIALEGSTRAAFGSMLNESRRYFLLQVLRRELAKRP